MQWLAPVAVAGLVMLPRLASPQFGLLDDGLTLQTGGEVIGRWSSALYLIPETGRFSRRTGWSTRPSSVSSAFGRSPSSWSTPAPGRCSRSWLDSRMSGGTRLQAALAVVVFALCGPAIETF